MRFFILSIRYLLMFFAFLIFSVLGLVLGLICPFNRNNNYILTRICRPMFYLFLGIKVKIINPHHLTAHPNAVFIGNHQSALDVILFGFNVPRKTLAIGKHSLLFIPIFGWMFPLLGNFFINRQNHQRAMGTMSHIKKKLMQKKCSILLMPEGTRNRDKGIGPFKKGAFYLAIQAEIPIVPIVASSLYNEKFDLGRWRAGEITLKVLPPILTDSMSEKDIIPLLKTTREQMIAVFKEIS